MKRARGTNKGKHCYDYPMPAVTVDVVLVTRERTRRVLLIRRGSEPFKGKWAIPGGFIEMDETLEESARRELREETGLDVGKLEPLAVFGDPQRDPRGRTISVAFIGQVEAASLKPLANDDAAAVGWHALNKLPPLAFDHDQILNMARGRIQRKRKRQRRG